MHCGFIQGGGAEMDPIDIKYVKRCKFVVASGIFDGYDMPHQPSNISLRSESFLLYYGGGWGISKVHEGEWYCQRRQWV